MTETKIAVMVGVREHNESEPVELWLNNEGRTVIRSYNECRNNCTDIDLADLLDWLRTGPAKGVLDDGRWIATLPASERN